MRQGGRARLCALYTALFTALAHGYRMLTLGFSGDAMLLTQRGEAMYQTSLGRFFQPVYWLLRGEIAAPLVIGLFTAAFLVAASLMTVQVLGLRSRRDIALTCGLFAANETMAVSGAAYLPWMDVYALALMLAVMGVYAFCRFRRGWLLSPACFCLSLGLYQSYLPAAASLFVLLFLSRALSGERMARVWGDGLRACASLLLGLIAYALALRVALAVMGTQASTDYNGVGRVGAVPLAALPGLLAQTMATPLLYLFDPGSAAVIPWHVRVIPAWLNLALLACALALLAARLRRVSAGARLTALLLLALLVPAMNFVQLIAQGTVSGLTIGAYVFFDLLCALLAAQGWAGFGRASAWAARAATALLCCVLGVGVVASNQMALKRDLEFSSTLSAVTRVLDRAEQTQGYVPGVTPVVLMGMLPSSQIAMERPGFERIARHQGMRYTYAASYETSTYWYLQMALGVPINLVDHERRVALTERAQDAGLGAFPAKDCCRMIDGVLYIRIN